MKEDHPRATADYKVCNNVNRNKSRDSVLKWDKNTICNICRTIWLTLKLHDFRMDESDHLYSVRRKVRGSKKKKRVVWFGGTLTCKTSFGNRYRGEGHQVA